MNDSEALERMRAMLRSAHDLAASEHVMVRVAGERIATIIADVFFEMDLDLEDFTALLPRVRRG